MRLFFGILALFTTCFCGADLTPYLKKDSAVKTETNAIEKIDFIYLINLDQRPEKLQRTLAQLKSYKINPHRFSAVYGAGLSVEAINNIGVKFLPSMSKGDYAVSFSPETNGALEIKRLTDDCIGKTFFFRTMTPGAIGCSLSHLSVLQDAYDSGYQTIWVMEDDIEVKQDPHEISSLIKKLDALVGKDGWDILYTDSDAADKSLYNVQQNFEKDLTADLWFFSRPDMDLTNRSSFAKRTILSEDFVKIGSRMRTHSMIIRRSGMKKILDFEKERHIFIPYDHELAIVPDIRLFNLRYDLVTHEPAPSDTHVHRSLTSENLGLTIFDNYLALYNLGISQKETNKPDEALESFFKAYALRPTRAEPLFQCAKIYREKGNLLLGYLIAKHALTHPYPKGDFNVEDSAYDHAILIEFTNCALLMGKFDEGLAACTQLLANQNLPQEYRARVQSNLALACGKLGIAQPEQSIQQIKNTEVTLDRTDIEGPKTIDILVRWDLKEVYSENWDTIRKQGYEVRVFTLSDKNTLAEVEEYFTRNYSCNTKKIIVMEDFIPRNVLMKIPKSKLVLFMWEPIGKTEDNDFFSAVYTFNDDLVGTKNYRKFCYPHLMPMCSDPISFKQKKLCTAVISHWLPERIELINFFMNHCCDRFDLFGRYGGPFINHFIYKGPIPAHHSASAKLNILKNYKFFLAFENSACPRYKITSGYFAPGYITEKIFGAFAAGCVPIYYGPTNIETYIPKNCFINYSDFHNPQELYNYILNMTEDSYEQYLQNIRKYLNSDLAKQFSQTAFEATVLEAAVGKLPQPVQKAK